MKRDLLNIDIKILLLRHGREKVLRAIAELHDQTPEQLENELSAWKPNIRTTSKKVKIALSDFVQKEWGHHRVIYEPLRRLSIDYENRKFLPTLKDVKRYLRSQGWDGNINSRDRAGPLVFRKLAERPVQELEELLIGYSSADESDYSLLSRAILGNSNPTKK